MSALESAGSQLASTRLLMEQAHQHGIQLGPSNAWVLLQTADTLVAAIEHVLALHAPDETSEYSRRYCRECGSDIPCATREGLENLL